MVVSMKNKPIRQIYSKHFKSHYAGKPTKRYLKLMRKIRGAEVTSRVV
jgi:hypothetical protein